MMYNKKITINFDMDGTIADLYAVENWLNHLENSNTYPYANAKPMLRFSTLARTLNELQKKGYNIAVISWLSKSGTDEYNKQVAEVKKQWLKKHLPSVKWDRITIVPYGTPKEKWCFDEEDVLFDDEERNRRNWTGQAYNTNCIMEVLRKF